MSQRYEQKTTKEMKDALVKEFGHKFSARKDRGTASHWVQISWTGGPTESQVRSFTSQFNDRKNDDMMTDLWCGSQYTSESRHTSVEAYKWGVKKTQEYWGTKDVKVTEKIGYDNVAYAYIASTDDFTVENANDEYVSRLIDKTISERDFTKTDEQIEAEEVEKARLDEIEYKKWEEERQERIETQKKSLKK